MSIRSIFWLMEGLCVKLAISRNKMLRMRLVPEIVVIRGIESLTEGDARGEIGDHMKLLGQIVCHSGKMKWFEWLREGDGWSE